MRQEEIWALTGREIYDYDALCDLDSGQLSSYCVGIRNQFTAMAKEWTNERNTEWVIRHYLAAKYIMGAQLKASAAAYATDNNLLIVVPYLRYYTLFHACRVFLLTRPNEKAAVERDSHKKIINCTASAMSAISREAKAELQDLLTRSQAVRELFSYRFPATGLKITQKSPTEDLTFRWSKRLIELAELHSECLVTALEKHSTGEFAVDWNQLADYCGYEAPEHEMDNDDYHRLASLSRTKLPSELVCTLKPGMKDDFFGAWLADEDETVPDHAFDPDQGYGPSLFDFL